MWTSVPHLAPAQYLTPTNPIGQIIPSSPTSPDSPNNPSSPSSQSSLISLTSAGNPTSHSCNWVGWSLLQSPTLQPPVHMLSSKGLLHRRAWVSPQTRAAGVPLLSMHLLGLHSVPLLWAQQCWQSRQHSLKAPRPP